MELQERHDVRLSEPESADNDHGIQAEVGLTSLSAFLLTLLNLCLWSWLEVSQFTAIPLSILGFLVKLMVLYVTLALTYVIGGLICALFLSAPIIVISNLILDHRLSLYADRRWQELTLRIACFLGPWILYAMGFTGSMYRQIWIDRPI
jgi:hypothetical protein